METVIATAILALLVGAAILYIVRAKKKGKKCIGCPYSDCPSRSSGGTCGCSLPQQPEE